MCQKSVWNAIAPGWTNYRNMPVPEAVDLAKSLSKNNKMHILDVGCGNARNLLPFSGHELYGIDFSENMISVAEKFCKKHNVKVNLCVADAEKLPYDDDCFDIVLVMAVFHHFAPDEQNKVLAETSRVMKPGASLLLTVWYKPSGKKEGYVEWNMKSKKYSRYYYFFTKKELQELLENSGFVIESVSITSRGKEKNIVVLAKKI